MDCALPFICLFFIIELIAGYQYYNQNHKNKNFIILFCILNVLIWGLWNIVIARYILFVMGIILLICALR